MSKITLIHTNDVHGRTAGLARVATILNTIRAESSPGSVVYLEAGDLEDTTNRLSNLTKGVQILQLLNLMDCAACTVGNAAYVRYGPRILGKQAEVTHFPLLMNNFSYSDGQPIAGVQPTTLLEINGAKLGIVGITCPNWYETYYPVRALPTIEAVKKDIADLRTQGAHGVIVLSHLGYFAPAWPGYIGDRELAAALQGEVLAIIGGHSHTLLPEGEWVGDVLVAQARHYAEYYGRIELEFDGERFKVVQARVYPVPADTPAWQPILDLEQALLAQTIKEMEAHTVGALRDPIHFAPDQECSAGYLMADALRERTGLDFACVCAGTTVVKDLPAGRLSRLALWEACWAPSFMGIVEMTGAQLTEFVRRGFNPLAAVDTPIPNRGIPRGRFHLSGGVWENDQLWIGGVQVDPSATYCLATTDFEMEAWDNHPYIDREWGLKPRYDTTIMLRELLEDYIARHSPVAIRRTQQYNPAQN
jgi:2',3'-cyclic-nucleotide 2'-phosphodiesterase (5'-nucleotidase family)